MLPVVGLRIIILKIGGQIKSRTADSLRQQAFFSVDSDLRLLQMIYLAF